MYCDCIDCPGEFCRACAARYETCCVKCGEDEAQAYKRVEVVLVCLDCARAEMATRPECGECGRNGCDGSCDDITETAGFYGFDSGNTYDSD